MSPDPLEDRVAALEQLVATLAGTVGTDTLQPNVLTVDPDGTIGANFTGHVHAQGLDLDAGTSATPPAQDRVRWMRTTDGALVASISSYDGGGFDAARLDGIATQDNNTAQALIRAVSETDFVAAQLVVEALFNGGGNGSPSSSQRVLAETVSQSLLILDGDGASNLLQLLGAPASAHVTWGIFSPFATAAANSSADYSANALEFGFPTAIITSVMGAFPHTTWSGFRVSNGINNNGDIHVENGATAQQFDVPYIAIGH